ncbi:MAG: TlpA disulfide reductase family protein [Phycisphaerales bacterium]
MRTLKFLFVLALVTLIGAPALAAPPTEAQIQAALDDYAALTESVRTFEQYEAAMTQFTAKHPEVMNLQELDARTIERLSPILTSTEARARDALARFAKLEAPDTIDGVVAMVNASYIDTHLERRLPTPERLASIMRHPRLHEALSSGYGVGLFELLAYFGEFRPEGLTPVRDEVLALDSVFTGDAPVEIVLSGMDFMGAADALLGDSPEDAATRERLRARVAGAMRAVRGGVDASTEPMLAEMLDDAILRTDGAYARGELLGHEAPELDFIWTSGDELLGGATKLSDLRGKVVVLDFWHTECSVCIATFPKVRALAKQYEGAPVVVLGVTSLRGRHGNPDGSVVDTEGNPQLEFDLMRDYIKQRNITWPIVFTKQSLFNPEYGVDATPHIAIIDPNGVVRYRALHPDMPMLEKIEKIDGILKEFGLPVPKAPGVMEGGEGAPDQAPAPEDSGG